MTFEEQIKAAQEAEAAAQRSQDPANKTQPGVSQDQGPVTIRTADGREYTGASYEEIARKMATEKPAAPPPEPVPAPQPGERVQWSDEQFAELFVKNPAAGLQYYEQTQYGFSPREVIPTLVAAVQQLAQDRVRREASDFAAQNKDYVRSDENLRAIVETAQERGLNINTAAGLQDAWTLAKAYGRVQTRQPRNEPTQMPHGRGRGGDGGNNNPLDALAGLSDNSLEDLFERNREGIASALRGRGPGGGEDF